MQWFRIIAVCCFIAVVLGCGGIGGRIYEERLVGDLELLATDSKEQLALIESSEGGSSLLVPATVFAVGWDESHLIAKRHPPSPTGLPNDKLRTEYFIIEVQSKKVYGPFDSVEFAMQRKRLSVAGSLDFTLTFREVE